MSAISDGYPTCLIGVRLMFGRSLHSGQHGFGGEGFGDGAGGYGVDADAFVGQARAIARVNWLIPPLLML